MGPLHHDVHLLNRALDGPARNDVCESISILYCAD